MQSASSCSRAAVFFHWHSLFLYVHLATRWLGTVAPSTARIIGGTLGRRRWFVEVNVVDEEQLVLRTSFDGEAVSIFLTAVGRKVGEHTARLEVFLCFMRLRKKVHWWMKT